MVPDNSKVPAPNFIRLLDPAITPATVKTVPEFTLNVPWLDPRATPLLALSVKSAVDSNVPPFKVK